MKNTTLNLETQNKRTNHGTSAFREKGGRENKIATASAKNKANLLALCATKQKVFITVQFYSIVSLEARDCGGCAASMLARAVSTDCCRRRWLSAAERR